MFFVANDIEYFASHFNFEIQYVNDLHRFSRSKIRKNKSLLRKQSNATFLLVLACGIKEKEKEEEEEEEEDLFLKSSKYQFVKIYTIHTFQRTAY